MADTHPKVVGSADNLNTVKGVSTVIVANDAEMKQYNRPLPRGTQIFNPETNELKISNGEQTPFNLPDHRHPTVHAPLHHTHMFGTNEPWLMTNPRIWYANDIANHPELIVLDGSEIPEERAQHLSQVYPGTKLLTKGIQKMTGSGFANEELELKVSSFKGFFSPSALFGETLDISNFSTMTDQWLADSTDLHAAQTVSLTFLHGYSYRPTQYIIMPAAGTSDVLFLRRPTPRSWVFEGSNDNGDTWDLLDERNDIEPETWSPCVAEVFDINGVTQDYASIRIRITEWNAGDQTADGMNLEVGLRRLWIMGRKSGTFALPLLETGNPEFVYVVPDRNLNIGLIHENVGDIGSTSVQRSLIPSYRLPADGRKLNKYDIENELLFAAIGHTHDPESIIDAMTASTGDIVPGGPWTTTITDVDLASYVEAEFDAAMIGGYKIFTEGTRIPTTWTIEGYDPEKDDWDILQEITDLPEEAFRSAFGVFYLDTSLEDKNYTKMRINFLTWNNGTEPIGISNFAVYVHEPGTFYIPNIPSKDKEIVYIVRNLTAVDVTPEIIQRLQKNIADLTHAHADLTNRVDKLDPNVEVGG